MGTGTGRRERDPGRRARSRQGRWGRAGRGRGWGPALPPFLLGVREQEAEAPEERGPEGSGLRLSYGESRGPICILPEGAWGAARRGQGCPAPHCTPTFRGGTGLAGVHPPRWAPASPRSQAIWGRLLPCQAHMSHARDSMAASDALGSARPSAQLHTPRPPVPMATREVLRAGPRLSLQSDLGGGWHDPGTRGTRPTWPPPGAGVSSHVPPAPCTQPRLWVPCPWDPLSRRGDRLREAAARPAGPPPARTPLSGSPHVGRAEPRPGCVRDPVPPSAPPPGLWRARKDPEF